MAKNLFDIISLKMSNRFFFNAKKEKRVKRETQRAPSPVRIPEELKQWLKHKAVDNFRSLNSEIVARLEWSRKEEEASDELQA